MNRLTSAPITLSCSAVCIGTAILLGCSSSGDPVAGGTGIPNQVAGVFIDPVGAPVGGAKVMLVDETTVDRGAPAPIDTTRTDTGGYYRFVGMDDGVYSVAALNADSSLVGLRTGVRVGGDSVEVTLQDTMAVPGMLEGTTDMPTDYTVVLQVAGTPFAMIAPSAGSFSFAVLPPGQALLLTMLRDDATDSVALARIDTLELRSGVTARVDALKLLPLGSGAGEVILDDFEDGDYWHYFGDAWWTFSDRFDGGNSVVVPDGSKDTMLVSPGAEGSAWCVSVAYTMGTFDGPRHVGVGAPLARQYRSVKACRDLSTATGISFWIKGTAGHPVSVAFISPLTGAGNIKVLDLPAAPSVWTRYSLSLPGDLLDAFAPGDSRSWPLASRFVNRIIFFVAGAPRGESGALWVDDVRLRY